MLGKPVRKGYWLGFNHSGRQSGKATKYTLKQGRFVAILLYLSAMPASHLFAAQFVRSPIDH